MHYDAYPPSPIFDGGDASKTRRVRIGRQERTWAYVTEHNRKLDTVLRRISAVKSNVVFASRVNHNHRPNLFCFQFEDILTFGGAFVYRDIFGVDSHAFFIHTH